MQLTVRPQITIAVVDARNRLEPEIRRRRRRWVRWRHFVSRTRDRAASGLTPLASTDTGHTGTEWAVRARDSPELVVDFRISRDSRDDRQGGKLITEAFYGMKSRESWLVGCSTGGRQGLAEAQRYPDDYNGIVSGAPAIDWQRLLLSGRWNSEATLKDPDSYIPPSKLLAINNATIAACDAIDGVKDGLVADGRQCKFDPVAIACQNGDSPNCLTAKQTDALKKIYAGSRDADGRQIYPGLLPGVERGWGAFTTGQERERSLDHFFSSGYMKYFVYQDANWDPMTFDFAKDLATVDEGSEEPRMALETMNSDLKPFRDRGGKLILYHGWGDDAISPLNTINYYKMVVDKTTGGPKAADAWAPRMRSSIRRRRRPASSCGSSVVPGMNHCGGGPGPNTFDAVTALSNWVEKKQAPDVLMGSHVTNGTTGSHSSALSVSPGGEVFRSGRRDSDAANFRCSNYELDLCVSAVPVARSSPSTGTQLNLHVLEIDRLVWMPRRGGAIQFANLPGSTTRPCIMAWTKV